MLVAPRPGGSLTRADTSLARLYGEVRVAWRAEHDVLTDLDVTLPDGVTATVSLPDGTTSDLPNEGPR